MTCAAGSSRESIPPQSTLPSIGSSGTTTPAGGGETRRSSPAWSPPPRVSASTAAIATAASADPGQRAAHGAAARHAREDDAARAPVGAESRRRDELVLEVADEVVAHGFSSSRERIPASPRETRLRITDSDVRAASAISP